MPSLLKSGSVLFRPSEESDLYALPGNQSESYLIDAPLERPYLAEISSDKNKLLLWRHGETIVIYDLLSGEENRISWQEGWPAIRGWSLDERIIFVVTHERTIGEGIVNEYFLVDPITLNSETATQEFYLPDYTFRETVPFGGFAVWNPEQTLILYTATNLKTFNVDYVLRNTITDVELWRYENVEGSLIINPHWSLDGNRILMSIIPPRGSFNSYPDRVLLASLTVVDLEFEVLSEITFLSNREYIWYVEWSPDTRYVLFEASPPQFQLEDIHVPYILDTIDGSIRQICDPDILDADGWWFPTANQAWWLPEGNQILYTVQKNDGYELKLFDVESWQTQILWHSEELINRTMNVIEWTPVEFVAP